MSAMSTGIAAARLVPGPARLGGHVARFGSVVALIGPSSDPAAVAAVLDLCRASGEGDPDLVVSGLSALAARGRVSDLCVVTAAGEDARTIVVATGQTQVVQRDHTVTAFVGETPPDHGTELVDLREGVVAADGFVLTLDDEGVAEDGTGDTTGAITGDAVPDAASGEHPGPPDAVSDHPGSSVSVVGVSCGRGHFNDPRAQYCAVCGLAMVQSSHVAVRDRRPTLGVLAFDTGEMVPMRSDLVIGRAPERHDRVRTGAAVAVAPGGETRTLSRVHAEMRVTGWNVDLVDCGSTNGTFVQDAGDGTWRRLVAGEAYRLSPGSRIAFGAHHALFESQVRTAHSVRGR